MVLSGLGLLGLWPLGLVIGALIKLGDRGPILFRQTRVGQFEKPFGILKFRSMVVHADRWGAPLAPEGDARVTRVGRWLRKTKLDELPQLWNVFRGEMSLVGPRPELKTYVDGYTPEQREILRFKPGITDPASRLFRHEATLLQGADAVEAFYVRHCLPRKLALNLEYARRASLRCDLWILAQTVCPRWLGVVLVQLLTLVVGFWLALELRAHFTSTRPLFEEFLRGAPGLVALQLMCLFRTRQLRGMLGYFGLAELRRTGLALGLAVGLGCGLSILSRGRLALAPSLLLMDGLLALWLLCAVRLACRWLRERSHLSPGLHSARVRRVAIVGTGLEATNLAESIICQPDSLRRVVAYFDDDPHTWGRRPYDVPVVGMPECLLNAPWRSQIDEVIVSLPEARPARLREIRALLAAGPLKVTFLSSWPPPENDTAHRPPAVARGAG